jgi:GT2 family glycosyltransferase
MRISVIIPTYRRPKPLQDCVESILRGSRLPEEILIVGRRDDAETIDSIGRIMDICDGRVIVQLAWVASPGHIPPIEAGARAASGDLLAIVDDDVIVTPEWLARLEPHFSDPKVGVTGGRVLIPYVPIPRVKGKPGCISWYGKVWGNIGAADGPAAFDVDSVMECNWMWRRELLSSLQFDDVLNFDDAVMYGLDLTLQAKRRGYRVVFEPEALVYHHPAPRSPELDRQNKGPRMFTYSRNCMYVVLKGTPSWKRPIFLAWSFLIGERAAWGAASLAFDVLTHGFGPQRHVTQALRGKLEGIRQWRMWKSRTPASL